MYILWPVGECLWETACCHSEIAVVQMCMMLCLKPPCDSFDHLDRLLGWMEDANTQQILGKWQETVKRIMETGHGEHLHLTLKLQILKCVALSS